MKLLKVPFCVRECNKLDNTIRDAESIKQITSMLMNTFLNQISLFSIHDPKGVNCLQDCSLCCVQSLLLHRNEHKFHHNFKDCGSLMCDCGAAREITCHFLLRCQFFSNERQQLHDDVYQIDASIKNFHEESLIDVLLYG